MNTQKSPETAASRVLSAFYDAAIDFGQFSSSEMIGHDMEGVTPLLPEQERAIKLEGTGPLTLGQEQKLQAEIIDWTVSRFLYLWTSGVPGLDTFSESLSEDPENPGDRLEELRDKAVEIALLAQYKTLRSTNGLSTLVPLCDLAKETEITDAAAVAAEIVLEYYSNIDKGAPEETAKRIVWEICPDSALSEISQLSNSALAVDMKAAREDVMDLFRAMCTDARRWAAHAQT